jgi:cupin fold WbuC family metalloprotein
MKFFKDTKSKSLSYRLKPSIHQIKKKNIILKSINNKESISRICLNSSKNDKLHQMIIFQTNKYRPKIKKELNRDKSFILIQGKQIIRIYNKKKKIIKKIILNENNFICWIKKNTYYDNICFGKKSVHLESLAGPFNEKYRKYLR